MLCLKLMKKMLDEGKKRLVIKKILNRRNTREVVERNRLEEVSIRREEEMIGMVKQRDKEAKWRKIRKREE